MRVGPCTFRLTKAGTAYKTRTLVDAVIGPAAGWMENGEENREGNAGSLRQLVAAR